jgi:putative DNA-invertase from lambdoid prophage Rac
VGSDQQRRLLLSANLLFFRANVRVRRGEQSVGGTMGMLRLFTRPGPILAPALLRYAMIKGWSVDEHFVEEGVSGSTPLADRPEGKRLLSMLGEGDVIVSAKLDRAFRSAADALTVLEELRAQGVGLHLIDLGGDVTGNGISKMVFTILAAVAEGERDRIRDRIRDARRHLASQGVFGGGKRPFGSDVVMDGKIRRLVPNEAEMAVIEQMRAMRREGATYRAIGSVTGHQPASVQRILERIERAGR